MFFLTDVHIALIKINLNLIEKYFIKVNPRMQGEHTGTGQITGIDIGKAQISMAEGEKIG